MLSWAGIAFIMAWAAAAPGPLDSPGCRPPVRDAMGSSSTLSSDEGKLGGNPGGFFLIGLMLLLFCCWKRQEVDLLGRWEVCHVAPLWWVLAEPEGLGSETWVC